MAVYNPAMSAKRVFDLLLVSLTALTVIVIGAEEVFGFLGHQSYLLWTANFVLLTAAVTACVPLALYHLYLSWQVTRSYLS